MVTKSKIAIYITIISIFLIIVSGIVFATVQVESNQELVFDCQPQKTETKTFIASSSIIDTGLWCADNANLKLYECQDGTCSKKQYLLSANKVDGTLERITGYSVGTKYQYECFECPVAPTLSLDYSTLTISEGERIEITASCTDSKGRVGSIAFKGWMQGSIRQADFTDAGEYSVKVICEDQNAYSVTEELIVTVLDINRAPRVHAVLRE